MGRGVHHQAHVHVSVEDGLAYLGGATVPQADLDARVLVQEVGQEVGQEVAPQRVVAAEHEAPHRLVVHRPQLRHQVVGLGQKGLRAHEEAFPGLGQAHASTASMEQRRAQLLLELGERGAAAGLAQPERSGPRGDASGAGHGPEQPECVELHGGILHTSRGATHRRRAETIGGHPA